MAIPYRKIPKGKAIIASAVLATILGGPSAAQWVAEYVAEKEGYVPYAYKCPANVWTKCFGDTTNVTPGMEYTFEECVRSLNEHLENLTRPVMSCVPELINQPEGVKVAAASMAYNIGPGAFCKSSVAKYFRAGEWERGCKRISEIYKTAKGVELPGLVKRRNEESAMCLKALEGK